MSVVELLLNVMGPVAIIVALGWGAAQRLDFDVATLSRLVFWVVGAAFVLDVFADATVESELVLRLIVAALAGMAAAGLVALLAARTFGLAAARTRASLLTSAYGNVGNAGLAISVFAFGDDAIPVAAALMVVINMAGTMVGIALASGGHGWPTALRRSVTSPMPLAAIVAVALNAFDLELPTAIDRSVSLLGEALIPVMLLTLGIHLAAAEEFRPDVDLGIAVLAKLATAPLVAAGVGVLLDLAGDDLGVLIIQSAMPPAVFCTVIAVEFDLEPERVTRTVLSTTLAALLTLPVVLVAVT